MRSQKEIRDELIEYLEKRFNCKIKLSDDIEEIQADLTSHLINALAYWLYRDYLHQQIKQSQKKP